ncbi:hypothetical protein A7K94_0208970 [Modestobacter sp. VKM Ac-2676]|nr:hypothetical protein A7K94_0208970 [Modestobacter sp. VKM Ac-2676]
MTTLFTVEGVSKAYGRTQALHPTDLTVDQGDSLGIIGESGSGKTTLSRIMLGLLEPDGGSVSYRGERVRTGRLGPTRLRSRVQLVLQDPYASLNPRMRIGRIIAEPLRLLGATDDVAARVRELLLAVELDPSWVDRYPHQLSGGQRQRVAIARALGPRPEAIVADEPVSALDVSVRATILALLRRLADEQGLTLVVISHDLGIVQRLCSRAVVLRRGRIVERGPVHSLLTTPEHPYTRELVAAAPRLPAPERTAP